ncbi:MAG: von Willebrand factor type A domain-containing protein [Verrucomicrobia bacterium]|nr:von Willebrand factor type A domain-containing protein [Verrucomicrobiota bacterium]
MSEDHESGVSREEIEIRLTALALGEVSAEEAVDLLLRLESDPELAAWYSTVQQTGALIGEALAEGSIAMEPGQVPNQLSADRRESLLGVFRNPADSGIQEAGDGGTEAVVWKIPWFIPLGIAAGIVVVLSLFLFMEPDAAVRKTFRKGIELASVELPDTAGLVLEKQLAASPEAVPVRKVSPNLGPEAALTVPSGTVSTSTATLSVAGGVVDSEVDSTAAEPESWRFGLGRRVVEQETVERFSYQPLPGAASPPSVGFKVKLNDLDGETGVPGNAPATVAQPSDDKQTTNFGAIRAGALAQSAKAVDGPQVEGLERIGHGVDRYALEADKRPPSRPSPQPERLKPSAQRPLPGLEASLKDGVPSEGVAPAARESAEMLVEESPSSTFSLNVSDVSFRMTQASLDRGTLPDPGAVRVEEFVNAFNYHDPEPPPGAELGVTWQRALYSLAQQREVLRVAVRTAAQGRDAGRPLNLVILLDNSGSMERADRVAIVRASLRVLCGMLGERDRISVVAFARVPHLWVDGLRGGDPEALLKRLLELVPEGGTNLEAALELAYETAGKHSVPGGNNRVVLLTDGAANLGEVDPEHLRTRVEGFRKRGIALDCFGIGWEGYNDTLLEQLSRNGDGRYGFVNAVRDAETGFARRLAGALQAAASDVKVQVEFNPNRVVSYRLVGYTNHQLQEKQFRDANVDAAELGAAESGNALYLLEPKLNGSGPLCTVRVRFKRPATGEFVEREWSVPYSPAGSLEESEPSLRLAVAASAFGEWLSRSPHAAGIRPDQVLGFLRGVPETFPFDPEPRLLESMIRRAGAIAGE